MSPAERWRSASEIVCILVPLAVIAFDVAARYWGGPVGCTVSAVVYDAAHRWPIVAFVLGMLAGHWLWPVR